MPFLYTIINDSVDESHCCIFLQRLRRQPHQQWLTRAIHYPAEQMHIAAIRTVSRFAYARTETLEILTSGASLNVSWTLTVLETRTVTTTSARTRVPASAALEQNVRW